MFKRGDGVNIPDVSYRGLYIKVKTILRPDASFYVIAIIYGAAASILSLAIPVSVQSLVNSVTFGILFQPLFVLSVVLLALLCVFGTLTALQTFVIEMFQRRFFARMGADISLILLKSNSKSLKRRNGPELVNRYFDIMTVQKNVSILLTGASTVILQTFSGLLLLAFYHPYFLIFDIFLMVMLFAVWKFFGRDAIATSIGESKAKYKMARWLEELSFAPNFFKTHGRFNKSIAISDSRINTYLNMRESHFKNLFLQIILLLVVYAFMSSIILGLGGFLVIKGQLALGQLVAAELVATVILGGLAKSGKYLEAFYDLVAAVEKLHEFYELDFDSDEIQKPLPRENMDLEFSCSHFRNDQKEVSFNVRFEHGKNYLINSNTQTSKLIFIDLARALNIPHKGRVLLGGVNTKDVSTSEVLEAVVSIERPVILETSIKENIVFGRSDVAKAELSTVLDIVGLDYLDYEYEDGLDTQLSYDGYPLWSTETLRMEIARAILAKPKVLILTEIFDQIEEGVRIKILNFLFKSEITVLLVSNKAPEGLEFDKVFNLERGGINA